MQEIVEFDKSINLFCLVFRTLELLFAAIFVFVLFTTDTLDIFHCSLNSVKSDKVTYNNAVFWIINFIAFKFIMLCDTSCNPNNLIEVLFIVVFSVNCLMCLDILLIVLKISKSSLSRSTLINLQPSSCSIAFLIFIS